MHALSKSETFKIFLLSIAILFLVFLASFLFFFTGFNPTNFQEKPLEKNMDFPFRYGDFLTYSAEIGNETGTVSFVFAPLILNVSEEGVVYGNCTKVAMRGTNYSTCIHPDGTDEGSNISIFTPFFFFSPWMLALNENFTWSSNTVNSLSGETIAVFSVNVIGEENILGREAFIVQTLNSDFLRNSTSRIWVDKKLRIVLKAEEANSIVELIQAPFPLQHLEE
ncbi:hypothetical protein KJ780_04335 [Candidatus Micrarchaeota archaeon]|nr:hypothetical protein [Candidatus Micrarchaeota archaeon]